MSPPRHRPGRPRPQWAVVARSIVSLILVAGLAAPACRSGGDQDREPTRRTTSSTQLSEALTLGELIPLDTQFAPLAPLADTPGAAEVLGGDEPVTLLAPSSEALEELGEAQLERLRADPDAAAAFVRRHVLRGSLTRADLIDAAGASVVTVDGAELPVSTDGTTVLVAGVPVTKADILAANGTLHVIGGVLPAPG